MVRTNQPASAKTRPARNAGNDTKPQITVFAEMCAQYEASLRRAGREMRGEKEESNKGKRQV